MFLCEGSKYALNLTDSKLVDPVQTFEGRLWFIASPDLGEQPNPKTDLWLLRYFRMKTIFLYLTLTFIDQREPKHHYSIYLHPAYTRFRE